VLLETKDLTKSFGGLTAVNHVSIAIPKGVLKAIIGPNGAGKTTLFNLITGILKPTRGRIFFKGEDITDSPPHIRSHKGIARSFQITNIFPRLTTLENVRIAAQSRADRKVNYNMLSDVRSYCSFTEKAYDLLSQVGLGGREHILACNLPHADQRKLEIAVALATEPHLLLLDEPTAGVAVEEVPEVMNVITGLKKAHRELTIIVIEHKLDVVMSMSESIIVMSEGRVIADDKPDRIARNELVQKAYLGETSEHFRG